MRRETEGVFRNDDSELADELAQPGLAHSGGPAELELYMKQENPIEEIWRIRDRMSAEENYDVHRLFERLRREQQSYAERLIQPPQRRAKSGTTAVLREEPPPYGRKSRKKS